jgi:sec-independent protein translocase protein TatA
MISVPDMAIIGALALMLFGPDQLPKVARKVGHVMRDVQNTSQSFVREMERAADDVDPSKAVPHYDPTPYDPAPYSYDPVEPVAEHAAESAVPAAPVSDVPPHARPAATPEYRVD